MHVFRRRRQRHWVTHHSSQLNNIAFKKHFLNDWIWSAQLVCVRSTKNNLKEGIFFAVKLQNQNETGYCLLLEFSHLSLHSSPPARLLWFVSSNNVLFFMPQLSHSTAHPLAPSLWDHARLIPKNRPPLACCQMCVCGCSFARLCGLGWQRLDYEEKQHKRRKKYLNRKCWRKVVIYRFRQASGK